MIGTMRKAVIKTKPGVIQRSARVPGQKYTQLTNPAPMSRAAKNSQAPSAASTIAAHTTTASSSANPAVLSHHPRPGSPRRSLTGVSGARSRRSVMAWRLYRPRARATVAGGSTANLEGLTSKTAVA